jgi:hypothetical protein
MKLTAIKDQELSVNDAAEEQSACISMIAFSAEEFRHAPGRAS